MQKKIAKFMPLAKLALNIAAKIAEKAALCANAQGRSVTH